MNITVFYCLIILSILNLSLINRNKVHLIKITSLIWCFIFMNFYSLLIINFDEKSLFQFIINLSWSNLGFNLKWGNVLIGIDSIALMFLGLSTILIPICILSSWNSIKFLLKEFIILLFLTLLFLVILFTVLELLSFYILFEIILIPVFLIIGIWGSREEKIEASFYFFFYTFTGSFLMLLTILKIFSTTGTTNILIIYQLKLDKEMWIFMGFIISLSIKIPMVPFHLWLPKAHVEAPISGSVLLAGILLKLGGYGLLRLIIPSITLGFKYFTPIYITLSIIAIIYGALSTLRQNDIKKLIAYSSISHMGIVTICIFTNSSEGLIASIIMMLGHGFISSAMFISTFVLYSRHHTRNLKYYKGLSIIMPLFSSFNLLLILSNIGFPFTLNFISEILAIKSLLRLSLFSAITLCLGSFLTLVYSFFLYNRVFFGNLSPYLYYARDLSLIESQSFIILILIIIITGITPHIFIDFLSTQILFLNTQ